MYAPTITIPSSPKSQEALQMPKSWELCFIGRVVVFNKKLLWEDNIPKASPHLHGVPPPWEVQAPAAAGSCCLCWGVCGYVAMLSWNHSHHCKTASYRIDSDHLYFLSCTSVCTSVLDLLACKYQCRHPLIGPPSHIWNPKAQSIKFDSQERENSCTPTKVNIYEKKGGV